MSDATPTVCGTGALTAAEILTFVKNNTGRTNLVAADIEDLISAVVVDVSTRHNFLLYSLTGTLTAGDKEITLPDNFLGVEEAVFDEEPLDPITFREFLDETIDGYAVRGKTMYIPERTSNEAYTVYCGLTHPKAITTIYFGDEFLEAVGCGVTAFVFRRYKQYDDAKQWFGYYESAIWARINAMPRIPKIGKVRLL